jgi:hypothetical protein
MSEDTNWSSFGDDVARAPDARRDRKYEPVVEYKAGEIAEVAVSLSTVPDADEAVWRAEIARVTGLTIPEGRRVELAQVRYWGSPEAPNVYCRFLLSDREDAADTVDAVQLLRDLRKGRRRKTVTPVAGDSAFVVSWNDFQTGKKELGGTKGLAARLQSVFDKTEARIAELRGAGRELGHLVIIGGGDLLEGCSIFPNQSFEIDSDRRTQIRNTVAFILAGIDQLAPLFEKVTLLVVGGNHGENRINGKRTNRHDNDDCAVFEHAATAVQRDPSLSHVKFIIARDEPAKTLDVCGWVLATTHGHVFRGGGHVAQKAFKWFSGQAAGRMPAGDADVLVSHHYHHHAVQDWGSAIWVQTPAIDGGSPFFTDGSGMHSAPGMLTWTMDAEHRFRDSHILEP